METAQRVLSVGCNVTVDGRGAGMLEVDNDDGTWSIGFDDGSEGDFPIEQIELAMDQMWRPPCSQRDAAALLAARHAHNAKELQETDERTRELLKLAWAPGKFITEVVPRLWLGDKASAQMALVAMEERGIRGIVNCTVELPHYHEGTLRYMRVPVKDVDNADISAYFDSACAFIDEILDSDGAVLVHCHAGRSRSATIVLVCLMRRLGLSLKCALGKCMERRWVTPNPGFNRLLVREERRLVENQSKILNDSLQATVSS